MLDNRFLHALRPLRVSASPRQGFSAAALALALPALLAAADAPKVTFLRDVAPILNKVGCTSGTCHGAAKGKNGFKLSLRGYDPSFDYQMLVHDVSGRRFNR